MEYPKTENLYRRNPETHVVGPEEGFRQPEVGLIGSWLVLDKLDGMNMRVIYKDGLLPEDAVQVYGRTDRAQIPGDLMASILSWATEDRLFSTFAFEAKEQTGLPGDGPILATPDEVILFGEGIGPGIQGAAGAAYGGEKRFVLFDVVVDGHWLRWNDVKDVARKLGIGVVSSLGRDCTLEQAKAAAVGPNFPGGEPRAFIEGGILRTDPYVFDWRGNRVGAKYKVRDL